MSKNSTRQTGKIIVSALCIISCFKEIFLHIGIYLPEQEISLYFGVNYQASKISIKFFGKKLVPITKVNVKKYS